MKSYKLAILTAAAGFLWSLNATAQTFTYNNSDLLLGFRTPGGTSDLIVDIGAASLYTGATGPITISGNYYTSQQLSDASLSLNNLYFSVFGDVSPGNPGTANTLWVTAPQVNNPIQATPWSAQTSQQQALTRSQIESIAYGATYTSFGEAASADNTATAVVVPSGLDLTGEGALSYTSGIGPNGNFAGNFGSNNNIEQDTPATFTSGTSDNSGVVRSDLFEMVPGSSGSYLGYFELNDSGTLTFNPEPVPEPTTWAVFGMGLAGLAGWRRITRKS
jgi:hypothetical protein